ncbi:MAG: AAA family ATPase [Spongiibacteraceae bacterium]
MSNALDRAQLESRIAQTRVKYEPHEVAYEQLKYRITMAVEHGFKSACVLCGDTGTGKSTLSERVLRDFPRIETPEKSIVPIIYYQLTSKPTIKGILQGVLKEFGLPIRKSDTEQDLIRILKTQIAACKTHVIILDDAQHFVEEGRRIGSIRTTADDMKVLIDMGLLIIFSGTTNLLKIFSCNSQLRRRSSTHVYLKPVAMTEHAVDILRPTVIALLEESKSGLSVDSLDEEFWVRFHFATNGNIAYINMLVAATAAEALKNKRTAITQREFKAAFETHIFCGATPATNPFSKDFECRPLHYSGEPFEGMETAA